MNSVHVSALSWTHNAHVPENMASRTDYGPDNIPVATRPHPKTHCVYHGWESSFCSHAQLAPRQRTLHRLRAARTCIPNPKLDHQVVHGPRSTMHYRICVLNRKLQAVRRRGTFCPNNSKRSRLFLILPKENLQSF